MQKQHTTPAELAALVPAGWQTGHILTDDGICLHYTRTGSDKPSLLLVHGHMMSGVTWLRTAQALQADFDVIMPDLRGHGRSGDPTTGYTMDLLAADLHALITALALENPRVIGHSNGAEAVITLAAAQPDMFTQIILEEPPFMPPPAPDAPGYSAWYAGWLQGMQALQAETDFSVQLEQVRALAGPWLVGWDDADFITYADAQVRFRLAVNELMGGYSPRTTDADMLRQVTAPVLLITGQPFPPGIGDPVAAMMAALPNGQHQHIEGAGHGVHVTQLTAFLGAVRSVL